MNFSDEFKYRYLNNIEKYKINYSKEEINKIFNRVYNGIFIDIDKTIIEEERFDVELLKIFYNILNKGMNIYFITGRGRTSAKNIIIELVINITKVMNKSKIEFTEQIFLITNNGLNIFYTDKNIDDKIFNQYITLVDKEKIKKFKKDKDKIIKEVSKIINDSKLINLNLNQLFKLNKNYSGELSIRFAFDKENIIDEINLKKIVNNYIQNSYADYYFFEGLYKDKKILEISLVNKNNALNYLLPILGVNNKNILKIGDQAGQYGNDYDFLNNFGGFSVNEFLKEGKVLPVLNDKGEILKGVNATKELIRNLKMYPPICLENVDKKLYSEKLAYHENLLEKRHRDIIDNYNKLISKSFMYSNNKYNINNIIDVISGGIFISDSEFYLLKKLNPRHLFFELFGIKKKRNYIYMIQNDTGYILRGSRNYYYGLAFRSNKGDIDKNLAEKINYNYFEFLNQVVNKMRNYKYLNNYIDRKILLGIMDNIRNMLLVFINVIIQKYVGENNVVVNLESENFKKITNIILKNLKFMYRELFFGNYYNLYNEYLSFLEVEVIGKFKKIYLEEYNSLESSFNYKKAYRVWRETDSFLENVMVIENTISNFSISKSCNFYGMRYGAIELPFIMKMILDEKFKQNNKNKYFIISLKNNYFLNHSDNNRLKYQSYEIKTENINNLQKSQNIILEDNILTGRTLQVVINDFLDNNIYIDKLIIVRYPTLNRIEHMMIKGGHGCPNTDLFSNKIIGLISPAPYSKFNQVYEVRTLKNLYKDELGVFNTTRHAIVRFLYKNKDFAIGSEVDYLVKGAENEYIRY